MGKHSAPDVTVPDALRLEDEAVDVPPPTLEDEAAPIPPEPVYTSPAPSATTSTADDDLVHSFWYAAEDFIEDGYLDEPAKSRLVKALKAFVHGALAAVAVAVVGVVTSEVTGGHLDLKSLVSAALAAAGSALVTYARTTLRRK